MIITKQQPAVKLLSYLQNKTSIEELVAWAEEAIMEGVIQDEDTDDIRDVLAKLGLADVNSFFLSWEDCVNIMKKLGYTLKIDANLVA